MKKLFHKFATVLHPICLISFVWLLFSGQTQISLCCWAFSWVLTAVDSALEGTDPMYNWMIAVAALVYIAGRVLQMVVPVIAHSDILENVILFAVILMGVTFFRGPFLLLNEVLFGSNSENQGGEK